jgi:hypothetical protein
MKLTEKTVLSGVSDALRNQVMPNVADGYAREAVRMAEQLIQLVARGMDDVAERRVAENRAIRVLLTQGAETCTAPDLAARLKQAAASADPGLKLSVLDTETARLRALLVELQEWLEAQESAATQALSGRIWRELRRFEQARAPRG